jgi:CDP-4-dehydro-6-deoxyglucose reductase
MKKWYEAQVSEILDISETKRRLILQIDPNENFEWIPGQFITLDLPIGKRRLERWRSYSIANTCSDQNQLELCIGKLENGSASHYFFDEIEKGTILKFKGPEGSFVLPGNLNRKIVMICTGTGVVPFRSMLKSLRESKKAFSYIHLIFGGRYQDEILYKDEFRQMTESYSNFRYSIALSREEDWAGHKGYVHKLYKEELEETKTDDLFMICGWTNMIDEAVANISELVENPNGQIHYELYG